MQTLTQGQVVALDNGGQCLVREVTDNFVEVDFTGQPGAHEYDLWYQLGYRSVFSPKSRTCNGVTVYEVIFKKIRGNTVGSSLLNNSASLAKSREADKADLRDYIHHLTSLLDSEEAFLEANAVATRAYEVLARL